MLEDFEKLVGDSWKTAGADGVMGTPILEAAIKEYQDPANADKLLKVQRELDDTKVVLVRFLGDAKSSLGGAKSSRPPRALGGSPCDG